jgi:hypothetical protein
MVFSPESAFDGGWSLVETENPELVAGWVFKATTIGEALDRQLMEKKFYAGIRRVSESGSIEWSRVNGLACRIC